MSRGGRGRGRGGRFGGRGGPASDLLRDSYEDCDFDGFQPFVFSYDDNSPPPLYPPMAPIQPNPLELQETYLLTKSREYKDR